MKLLRELKWSSIVSSVVYIGVGVALLIMPDLSLTVILSILSIGMVVAGVLSLLRYFIYDAHTAFYRNDFLFGLIGIALGSLIYLRKDIFASLIPILLGVVILFSGFVKLQDSIDARRLGYKNSLLYIVLAIINVIAGIVVILNPFATNNLLFMLIGASLVYSGISDLVSTVYLSSKINKLVKQAKDSVIDVEANQVNKDEKNQE